MPTMSTVDLSERDNKETLFVKEEVTNDAEVFGEVVVDVEGSQRESSSSVLLLMFNEVLLGLDRGFPGLIYLLLFKYLLRSMFARY